MPSGSRNQITIRVIRTPFKGRSLYITLVAATILSGILSRQVPLIPLIIGDMLYAVMAYFAARTFFIRHKPGLAAISALLFCFAIEFGQLYRAEWIINVRNTFPGHYLLGQGFRWDDLLAHIIGIAIVFTIDRLYSRKDKHNSKQ